VHVTLPHTLALQICGLGQDPHWRTPPQPSLAVPQLNVSSAQVFGVHTGPQTLFMPPPPQFWPLGQLAPHWMVPPHPSAARPQLKPSWAQVCGVHVGPHMPDLPPAPHDSPAPQVPH
jgi:hypothetical protein